MVDQLQHRARSRKACKNSPEHQRRASRENSNDLNDQKTRPASLKAMITPSVIPIDQFPKCHDAVANAIETNQDAEKEADKNGHRPEARTDSMYFRRGVEHSDNSLAVSSYGQLYRTLYSRFLCSVGRVHTVIKTAMRPSRTKYPK